MSEPLRYEYTVITRENAVECDLSPEWWKVHPEYNFFVRTNVRVPEKPRCWIGGGGETLQAAISHAEFALRQFLKLSSSVTFNPGGVTIIAPAELVGTESATIIRNRS